MSRLKLESNRSPAIKGKKSRRELEYQQQTIQREQVNHKDISMCLEFFRFTHLAWETDVKPPRVGRARSLLYPCIRGFSQEGGESVSKGFGSTC